MLTFAEMDKATTLAEQYKDEVGPVVLINDFKVPASRSDEFLDWFQEAAAVMQRQPGFLSTQLHRGVAGSETFVNYAVWESVAAFRNAFTNPDFRGSAQKCPDGTIASPHLFQKIAVPGVCIA